MGPVILVIVLARLPRPSEIAALFAGVDPYLLGASLAINLIAIHLKVVRWQVLLRARGIRYGTRRAWVAFSSSLYLAMLTPGRVGDALRVQYLHHDEGTPYSEGLASVVMDRLCDLYVLAALFAVAIAHYGSVLAPELRFASWAVVAITVLAPLVLVVPGTGERVVAAIHRRLKKTANAGDFGAFFSALRALVGRQLAVTLPITVLAFAVAFGQAWVIASAMGLDLSYFDVACLTAVANLLALLPITVSGVGVREALFAAIFPSLGLTVEQGVGFGLLVFVVVYLAAAAIGFVTWQIRPPPQTSARGTDVIAS